MLAANATPPPQQRCHSHCCPTKSGISHPVFFCHSPLQDYIGETGELALSAVIAGVDTAVNEDGGILAKRERTEQVRAHAVR